MSILLVGIDPEHGLPLVARLRASGDQVRVVTGDAATAERWRSAGAYVARGDPSDPDLVERAAQDVRTIVFRAAGQAGVDEMLEAALEGGALAAVGRIVVFGPLLDESTVRRVQRSGLEHVLLRTPGPRRWPARRPAASPERIAEAIDAADALVEPAHEVLDLSTPWAWIRLGLPGDLSRGSERPGR